MRIKFIKLFKPILLLLAFLPLPVLSQPDPEWIRFYEHGGAGYHFGDVAYTQTHRNPGFATCGIHSERPDRWNLTVQSYWLMATDGEGDPILDEHYFDVNVPGFLAAPKSIIGTDDGGYLIGGGTQYIDTSRYRSDIYFTMLKADQNGGLEWLRYYGSSNYCEAVIELKDHSYVGCGRLDIDGVEAGGAVLVNNDGDVSWAVNFLGVASTLYAIRETDDGLVFTGMRSGGSLILKTNFDGELQWVNRWSGRLYGLVSCPDGGFAACGSLNFLGQGHAFYLVRIDDEGNELWSRTYNITDQRDHAWSLVVLSEGGFLIVGEQYPNEDGRTCGEMVLTDRSGNMLWSRVDSQFVDISITDYDAVVLNGEGAPVIAGKGVRRGGRGILLEMPIIRFAPVITNHDPVSLDTTFITGDSYIFAVSAEDLQGDSIRYCWTYNNAQVSRTSRVRINFNFQGDFPVKCVVSDGEYADSILWNIHVRDIFITSFTPDTLSLAIRRGESVDFSLDTIRAVEGDPVEYLWLKRNVDLGDEVDTAGTESRATVPFLQSGHYRVDGVAYRKESSDVVSWDVSVRGAIWAFAPEDLAFEVLPDSTVSFIVEPTIPDAEGQTIQWLVDGELAAEDTTLFNWSFGEADSCPPHLVQVVVADTVESDTVTWTVTVVDPDFVSDKRDAYPTRADLLSVSPNPFNSTLTIRYSNGTPPPTPPASGGGKVEMRLAIYDISGRLVADFSRTTPPYSPPSIEGGESAADRGGSAAERNVIWDASSVPAGVYFVRLQTGSKVATKKVLLMR